MDAVDRRRQEVQARLRGMIREAVRTKLGLLNESGITRGDRKLVVTNGENDTVKIDLAGPNDEYVLGIKVYSGESTVYEYNAETASDKTPPLVSEFSGRNYDLLSEKAAGTYDVSVTFGNWNSDYKSATPNDTLLVEFKYKPTATSTAAATTTAAAVPTATATIEAPVVTPQQASMSVQDKIKKGAQAIASAQYDDRVMEPISFTQVAEENQMDGHTWLQNESRSSYKLNDWSLGDAYTYFALVNKTTKKPVAFVVASDPEENNHFSTGRFIGPNSTKPNLRKAFCILYHRATGEVHESCYDGPTTGSEDDVPGGGRGGKGTDGAETDSVSKGAAAGASPGAKKIIIKNGKAKSGRGDPSKGSLGITRPAELLRKSGKVFITKSLTKEGFTGFPKGQIKLKAVLSIRVKFKHPMGIDSDANGYRSQVKFGANTGPGDIEMIQLSGAWGTVWSLHPANKKLKPGDDDFQAAAKWVFANQEQFDLASEDTKIVGATSTATAAAVGVSQAVNRGESVAESRRRPSLMDLYRF